MRLTFQVFIPDSAPQAFFLVAVFFFELDEGLTVTCVFYGESTELPHPYDMVVFWAQGFKEVEGAVAVSLLAAVSSVGEEDGDDGVDDE